MDAPTTGVWDTDDRAVRDCDPRTETELEGFTDLLPNYQLALPRV